jgi:hypothetical protein
MRLSKALGSVVAAAVAIAAVTLSGPSNADDDSSSYVTVTCAGGKLSAKGMNGWEINGAAPWKWNGQKFADSDFTGCDKDKHCASVSHTGDKCSGDVSAFVCNAKSGQCKGPMKVAVK